MTSTPQKNFEKKVFHKIKFNKNMVLRLKFYAESIKNGIKHVWGLLCVSKLHFVLVKIWV